MKPWVIYTRVSSEEQAREGVSLDAQRKACRGFLGFQELPICDEIEDAGESGKNLKRPGAQKLLRLIEGGTIGGIVIYRLDRLTRSTRDLDSLLTMLERHQVKLQSVSEKLDTSNAMGRFFVNLIGLIAQWERETIGERVKMGINHRKQQGGYIGTVVPAGTIVVGERGKRELRADPKMKDIAAHAWQLAAQGKTLGQIADYLNDHEIRPHKRGLSKQQHVWYKPTLHYWLTNQNLVGLLIDRETFLKAGAMLKSRGNPMRPGNRVSVSDRIWPLKNIARCLHCGGSLVGVSAYGRNKVPHYYLRCTTKIKSRAACAMPDLPANEFERIVLDTMLDAVRDQGQGIIDQMVDRQRKAAAKCADIEQKIAAMKFERDGLKQQISRVVDVVARGGLAGAACEEKLAQLQTGVIACEHQISELEGVQAAASMSSMNNQIVVDEIRQGVEGLRDATPDEVAHGFLVLIREVRLSREAVEIDLYGDLGSYKNDKERSLFDRVRTIIQVRRELAISRKGRGQQWVVGFMPSRAGRRDIVPLEISPCARSF